MGPIGHDEEATINAHTYHAKLAFKIEVKYIHK
jgi:hypothetical protein